MYKQQIYLLFLLLATTAIYNNSYATDSPYSGWSQWSDAYTSAPAVYPFGVPPQETQEIEIPPTEITASEVLATSETSITTNNLDFLTSQDLEKMIEQSLKRHDWAMTEHLADALINREGMRGMGAYGKALALTQQEQYASAITILKQISQSAQGGIRKATSDLLGTLHLQMAEISLLENNYPTAEKNLNQYSFYENNQKNSARFNRLQTTLKGEGVTQRSYLRVGVLLPLSGPHAPVGKTLLNAMKLAVFDTSSLQIVLYPEDTKSDAGKAATAAKKLANLGVEAIVGPLLSVQVDEVKKAILGSQIPLISFSTDPHVAAENVHLISFRPDAQARIIARQALTKGKTRVAALIPSTPYGYEVFDAFKDELSLLGGDIVNTTFYNPENPDISPALESLLQLDLARKNLVEEKKLLEQEYTELGNALPDEKLARMKYLTTAKPEAVVDFDALFLPANPNNLSLITAQLAIYDVDRQDVLTLGTSVWDVPDIRKSSEYVNDGLFPAAPNTNNFDKSFKIAYGMAPLPMAVLGYDAIDVLAKAAAINGSLTQNLLRPEGFITAGGALRFMENGKTERAFALKGLKGKKLVHVKHSPKMLPPKLPNPINPNDSPPVWRYSPW